MCATMQCRELQQYVAAYSLISAAPQPQHQTCGACTCRLPDSNAERKDAAPAFLHRCCPVTASTQPQKRPNRTSTNTPSLHYTIATTPSPSPPPCCILSVSPLALPAGPIMHTPSPMLHQQCTTTGKETPPLQHKRRESPNQAQRTHRTTASAAQHRTYQQHAGQAPACTATAHGESAAPTHMLRGVSTLQHAHCCCIGPKPLPVPHASQCYPSTPAQQQPAPLLGTRLPLTASLAHLRAAAAVACI